MLPIGVLVNSATIIGGSLVGVLGTKVLPAQILLSLTPAFGLSAVGIGIVNCVKLETLPVVVLALIIGTLVGEALKLEQSANRGIHKLGSFMTIPDKELFLSLVVLFCFSGTGIFGSISAGMNGDFSILYTKAILDFFTAFSFAATLGMAPALIALPQFAIQALLFHIAALALKSVDLQTIGNFQAVGGLITIAIGIRILKIRDMNALNYTPALILVFPLTKLWSLMGLS